MTQHWRRHNKGRRLRLARTKVGREVQLLEILRTGCGSVRSGSRESASARAWTSVSEQLVHVVESRQKSTSKECNLRTNDRSFTRLRRASIQTFSIVHVITGQARIGSC